MRTKILMTAIGIAFATAPAHADTIAAPTMGCTLISDAQMFGHLRDAADGTAQVRFQQEKFAAKLCDLYERGTQVQVTQQITPPGELSLACVRKVGATSCGWVRSVYVKELQR